VGCIYACIHKTFYLFAAVEFFPRPVHNLVDFCCFAFATQLDITFVVVVVCLHKLTMLL